MNNHNGECPVCGARLNFTEELVMNELVDCPDCGTELEVENTNPPLLIEAPTEEEDWGE